LFLVDADIHGGSLEREHKNNSGGFNAATAHAVYEWMTARQLTFVVMYSLNNNLKNL